MAVTVVSSRIDNIEASCAVLENDYLRIDQFDAEGCYVHVRNGGDYSTMRLLREDARALIKALTLWAEGRDARALSEALTLWANGGDE